MSAERRTWAMWAHQHKGSYQHIGDRWWVEIHHLPDPVVPVTVEEVAADAADGTHWGWMWAEGHSQAGSPRMIWAFKGAFDAQFPYGTEVEEEAGKGEVVRLRITQREAVP